MTLDELDLPTGTIIGTENGQAEDATAAAESNPAALDPLPAKIPPAVSTANNTNLVMPSNLSREKTPQSIFYCWNEASSRASCQQIRRG